MQSAEDWDGCNVADPLNNALQGCVLLQRQMRARTVVISRIGQQDAAQVTLTAELVPDPGTLDEAFQLDVQRCHFAKAIEAMSDDRVFPSP